MILQVHLWVLFFLGPLSGTEKCKIKILKTFLKNILRLTRSLFSFRAISWSYKMLALSTSFTSFMLLNKPFLGFGCCCCFGPFFIPPFLGFFDCCCFCPPWVSSFSSSISPWTLLLWGLFSFLQLQFIEREDLSPSQKFFLTILVLLLWVCTVWPS